MRAVLFDFDGVIVQSELVHKKTFLELLSRYGIEISNRRWYREFAGTGSRHIFKVLVRENGINENVDELVERRKKIYEARVRAGEVKETKGARELLLALQKKGIKCAIVSGSHRSNVELTLSVLGLGEFFDLIVSGDDLKQRKPDPGPFLHAAKKLGFRPDECIVIEDSYPGCEAGKRAGMKVVWIRPQANADASMEPPECDLAIDDFRGLKIEQIESL